MSADNVTRAAERTFVSYAVYGISVEGVIDTTVQETGVRCAFLAAGHEVSVGLHRQATGPGGPMPAWGEVPERRIGAVRYRATCDGFESCPPTGDAAQGG